MRLRRLTRAERLTHPWWGIVCPSCGAAPGEPCGADDGHIHGQRTTASTLGWVDPRKPGEPDIDEEPRGQLALWGDAT